MVGLVLSPEQIRAAPPEVRAWLHAQLEAEYGGAELHRARDEQGSLAAMEPAEAATVLERIRGDFLATQVFFELGRESAYAAHLPPQLHRVAIPDMLRHTQLGDAQHLGACLDTITAAFREVRNDPAAMLVGFDQSGGCYVHKTTQQSIRAVWRQLARPVRPAADEDGGQPRGA